MLCETGRMHRKEKCHTALSGHPRAGSRGAHAQGAGTGPQVDLDHQANHGVAFQQYWVDLAARKVFCLVEAPSADAAAAVHREGNGLLANRIYEVVEGH